MPRKPSIALALACVLVVVLTVAVAEVPPMRHRAADCRAFPNTIPAGQCRGNDRH